MIAPVENNSADRHTSTDHGAHRLHDSQATDESTPRYPLPQHSEPLGMADRISDAVGRHPVAAVATATVIGAIAGWIIKRRL
ncbi:hypothetical protein NHH03_24405 [Stieleria sp. TO1_6]|uniref:hypothetical protein n=1 Tax=Stieleria tagensis TaxID=2956795 RepID=UPI00209AEBAF|nr:hypothetical protein [Stieleria tagensis]MCO8124902.1 hypothetical protein [Stieleria tagensis]